jgi:hypothetical protein
VTGTERGEQRELLGVLGAGSGGVDHDPQIAARDAQDAGDGVDVRAGRRQPPVHHRARADPGAAPVRSGTATHSTDAGAGRQGLLEQHRGFAARYDKLAVRYEDAAEISDIDIWLRDLSHRA